MITPFSHQPYVYFHKGQEKRERVPMDVYLSHLEYAEGGEVPEGDDLLAEGSTKVSLSSAGPSFAMESSEVLSSALPQDDGTVGGESINTISTVSTLLPVNTKRKIRKVVKTLAKETEYEYREPDPRQVGQGRLSRLWIRFVTGPWMEWKRKKAEERRHPVLRYFENRIFHFEAKRIADVAKEMEEHERFIQKAAVRLSKLRKSHGRTKSIQEKIANQHLQECEERDRQHARHEFNVLFHQKWASEARDLQEGRQRAEDAGRELAIRTAEEQSRKDEINNRKKYELSFIEDDIEETQRINEIMRRAGVVAGVNAPVAPPSNLRARVADRSELVERESNKKLKNISEGGGSRRGGEAAKKSDYDRHQSMLKGLGLRKAPPPVSRKARELVVNLSNSVDFSVNPKVKGRMPWHNSGMKSDSGGVMAVFDIDLSLYREVQVLRCENIGERGALCLAAEFVRGACPSLQILNLNRCQITTRGFGRLLNGVRLARLDNLVTLQLRGNQLGARSVEYIHNALEKGALSNVTLLDLRENELGLEGAYAMASLLISGIVVTLREIKLQRNNFGNEGFAHMVNVLRSIHDEKCRQIESVKLGENGATVDVISEFEPYPFYIQP